VFGLIKTMLMLAPSHIVRSIIGLTRQIGIKTVTVTRLGEYGLSSESQFTNGPKRFRKKQIPQVGSIGYTRRHENRPDTTNLKFQ